VIPGHGDIERIIPREFPKRLQRSESAGSGNALGSIVLLLAQAETEYISFNLTRLTRPVGKRQRDVRDKAAPVTAIRTPGAMRPSRVMTDNGPLCP
jgi:hypothetical protein